MLGGQTWSIDRVWAGIELVSSSQERIGVTRRRVHFPELLTTDALAAACAMLGLMVGDMASPSLRLMTHLALDGRGEPVLRPWFR